MMDGLELYSRLWRQMSKRPQEERMLHGVRSLLMVFYAYDAGFIPKRLRAAYSKASTN
jgi:hypothetical protein